MILKHRCFFVGSCFVSVSGRFVANWVGISSVFCLVAILRVFQQLFSCVERVVDVCVLWTIQLVRRMLALCFGVRSALRVVCFHVCCSYQIQECVFLSVASCKLACFPLPTRVFLQVWSGRPFHQAVEGEIVEVIEGEIMEVMCSRSWR